MSKTVHGYEMQNYRHFDAVKNRFIFANIAFVIEAQEVRIMPKSEDFEVVLRR